MLKFIKKQQDADKVHSFGTIGESKSDREDHSEFSEGIYYL
jgi:hypothetical protein